MTDPSRHFAKLAPMRRQLEAMASRYPSGNADFVALYEAVRALDRAALHFGLAALWFTGRTPWGGHYPHHGCIEPLQPEAGQSATVPGSDSGDQR